MGVNRNLHCHKIIIPTNQIRLAPMSNSSPDAIVTTAEIIDRLTQATTDLLWSSESDYPFEIVTWAQGTEITPTALFNNLDEAELSIQAMTINDFFEPVIAIEDWYAETELAIVDRYKALLATIEANLSAVQIFRIGEIEVAIYIVGNTPTGDLIGLKTYSIET
jgi:hypothetical protein